MIKVRSSWIEGVKKLGRDRIEVVFKRNEKTGEIPQPRKFKKISDTKLLALVGAPSVGAFFNFSIRDNPIHQVVE